MRSRARPGRRWLTAAVLGLATAPLTAACGDEELEATSPYVKIFAETGSPTELADVRGTWTTPEAAETTRIRVSETSLLIARRCRAPDDGVLLYVGVTVPITLSADALDVQESSSMRAEHGSGYACAVSVAIATFPFRLANASLEVSFEGPPATFQKVADEASTTVR